MQYRSADFSTAPPLRQRPAVEKKGRERGCALLTLAKVWLCLGVFIHCTYFLLSTADYLGLNVDSTASISVLQVFGAEKNC